MNDATLTQLATDGLIIFAKDGIIDSVKAPNFGEVVLKYRDSQPYAVAVTENKRI